MSNLNPTLKPPAAKELEEYLKNNLKGQPEAIQEIVQAYIVFLSQIREFDDQEKKKPIGVFLFLGHPGTGKTEIGRVLAKKFHGTQNAATIIECGSYQKDHEIAKLIGSPPGYIGYEDKPRLSKDKLYSQIPGYQIKPSALESKKEKTEKEETDEPTPDEIFSFWLSQLDLIDQGLRNLQRDFSQLKKLEALKKIESNSPQSDKIRKNIRIQREILETQRNYILASFTKLIQEFLHNRDETKSKKVQTPHLAPKSMALQATPKEKPILVIIFDEIEKAHEALHQFLLHLMDEGRAVLANSKESEVDLSRAFIILTSNIASNLISKTAKGVVRIGFAPSARKSDLEKMAKAELKKRFSPEFLRRLTSTVIFNLLSPQDFRDILELKIKNLTIYLEKYLVELEVESAVKEFILEETGKKPEEQVKALWDSFKQHMTNPIGNLLATGQLTGQKKLTVTLDPQTKQVIFKN